MGAAASTRSSKPARSPRKHSSRADAVAAAEEVGLTRFAHGACGLTAGKHCTPLLDEGELAVPPEAEQPAIERARKGQDSAASQLPRVNWPWALAPLHTLGEYFQAIGAQAMDQIRNCPLETQGEGTA